LKENNIQLEERILTVNKIIDTISKSNKTNTTNMTVKEYKTAINSLVKEILTNKEIISDSPYFYKDDYFKYRQSERNDIYKDRIIISTTTDEDSDNTNIYEFFLEKNDIQSKRSLRLLEIIYDTLNNLIVNMNDNVR
jgi:stalled ribosome rescue protein Dom34